MSSTSWSALREKAKEAKVVSFDPLPVGEYNVEVESAEAGHASTGARHWKLKCRVTDGPHEDRRVWCDIYLNEDKPNSVAMFFEQMAHAGLDEWIDSTGPSDEQVADMLATRPLRILLKSEKYKNETKVKFSKIVAANGASPAASAAPAPTPTPSASPDVKPPF